MYFFMYDFLVTVVIVLVRLLRSLQLMTDLTLSLAGKEMPVALCKRQSVT